MLVDLSYETKSEFLPYFVLPVYKSKFANFDELKNVSLEKEKYILDNYKPRGRGNEYWVTNRKDNYSMFDFENEYPVLKQFKKEIKNSYENYCKELKIPVKDVYISCWLNVVRKGSQHITQHNHADAHLNVPEYHSYVSGHICIQATGTRTYYKNPYIQTHSIGIVNVPGEMYLFPSWVDHWADPNQSEEPRITIAFDIVTEEVYNIATCNKDHFSKL